MSDRDLQDEIIRALADAPYRHSPPWQERRLADPERMERFARFLARNFYRHRVNHFFRYSRSLAPITGRGPDAAVRGPGFDALLEGAILGSKETTSAVAALVVERQRAAPEAHLVPYLDDLLRYEEAMMVVEAGPRDWSEDGGPAGPELDEDVVARVVEGTTVVDLDHDLPRVLPLLRPPVTDVPEAPRRPVRLVVARTRHGRVSVARLTDAVAQLLELADGRRTLRDLAAEAGIEASQLPEMVRGLTGLGAIRMSTGS